jgi:hypothetical protein
VPRAEFETELVKMGGVLPDTAAIAQAPPAPTPDNG